MRKMKKILLLISLSIFIFVGCEEKVLDKSPRDSFSDQDIWSSLPLAQKYLNNIYNVTGNWGLSNSPHEGLSSLCDETYNIHNVGSVIHHTGAITPDNLGTLSDRRPFVGSRYHWDNLYFFIRQANIFLQNIDAVPGDEDTKKRLKGEAKFLRAKAYHRLIRFWGGVPIINNVFSLDDDFIVPRDSYKACVEFIVSELDEAKDMVPLEVPSGEWGRVTKGAVLTLKAQVLLYAASKLHDPGSQPNGPLYTYDKANKWQDAADAIKAVMDLGIYELVQVNDAAEYQALFFGNSPEIIFAKPNDQQYSKNAIWAKYNTPNGYSGWSGHCPTHNFVQTFQMSDGMSVDESPLYHDDGSTGMYENREMRFYANIVYQGCFYRGRNTEFYIPGGVDSKDGPGNWNTSKTGYTIRKYMDESYDFQASIPPTPYIIYRLAEIYLMYAEAQYELGNEDIAREYVNKIRNRAHLPDLDPSLSGEELMEAIRHEKLIELCFENQRYFDITRWMIAEDVIVNAEGVEWRLLNAQGQVDPNGELKYIPITTQVRVFPKKQYYMPIPRYEVQKAELEQNDGYN
jgi:starch-binding outer membrane protein, SusD/RagB family